MSDISELTQLTANERLYRVSHQNQRERDCFWPDAQIFTSWQAGNLDSFIGVESKEVNQAFPIVGSTGVPAIHIKGNKAYVELPTTTRMRMYVKDIQVELTSFRRLIDYCEKRDGEWRIVKLVSINETDKLAPVYDGEHLELKSEDFKNYRISYQFLAYTRHAAGGDISQDLLGTDRPADSEKLYSEAEDWLNN